MKCLLQSLSPPGIAHPFDQSNIIGAEGKPVLVGGTDEASVNVAEQNGMKGMMQGIPPMDCVVLVLCLVSS